MKVFKFGGASIKDAAGVRNVAAILQRYQHENLLIVVSAMGKNTNALEEVVDAHAKQTGKAQELYDAIKERHYTMMHELFDAQDEVFALVNILNLTLLLHLWITSLFRNLFIMAIL